MQVNNFPPFFSVFIAPNFFPFPSGQAIIDAKGNVEQALEDLLLYFQAYETALELCHADACAISNNRPDGPAAAAAPVSAAPPQMKSQEDLDLELAMRLQAEYDREAGMRRQPRPKRVQQAPEPSALDLDFTFLTDEQRALLANAAKQGIAPILQGVLTSIAIPPFEQTIGKHSIT